MDWFFVLSPAVQIAVAGLASGIIAIVATYINAKVNPKAPSSEHQRPPLRIELSEIDRDRISRLSTSIDDHAEEIGKHRDELIRNAQRPRSR